MDYLMDEWPTIEASWVRAWARQDKASRTVNDYRLDINSYLAWCKEQGVYSVSLES